VTSEYEGLQEVFTMDAGIGRSTNPSTARNRDDVSGSEPASFRYNNPGAQYPSAQAAQFGQIGYGIIGGGHEIARFPCPVNGAASNFDLLYRNYTGMEIGAAGTKWTGANGFGVPGYDPRTILTTQMLDDPVQAIALLKAIAGRESGHGNNLTEEQWRQAHRMFKAGSADAFLDGLPIFDGNHVAAGAKTGEGLLKRAREHIGEEYRHVQVPKDNADWKGPWDCSEFVSWLVFQEADTLYGCVDDQAVPSMAHAYTGAWKTDVEKLGKRVSVDEAAATVGGIVLRYPPQPGMMGHIALCDGKGGTVEAKGQRYGVIADTVHGRGWDTGILIPQITYNAGSAITVVPPGIVYKLNAPNMNKDIIISIQTALASKGFSPGPINGDYGLTTQAAVAAFQQAEGLVVDGEVGPETSEALGVSLLSNPVAVDPGQNGGVVPPVLAGDPLQLLTFLMMLSKEKPMVDDPAKPGQGIDLVNLLLPLLLQSVLTGKQIDSTQLLTVLLTGKSAMPLALPSTLTPQVQPQPGQLPRPTDLITLLLPLIFEKLSGKPWPGTTPDQPKTTQNPPPDTSTQPIVSKPSVQIGAAGLGISTILQALGFLGMPFGLPGPAGPTPTGTLATLLPIIIGAVGATGGFGPLLGLGSMLLGGIGRAVAKPK
jgi:Putative peptidoglycan binding domain